jgi:hypothetical protein
VSDGSRHRAGSLQAKGQVRCRSPVACPLRARSRGQERYLGGYSRTTRNQPLTCKVLVCGGSFTASQADSLDQLVPARAPDIRGMNLDPRDGLQPSRQVAAYDLAGAITVYKTVGFAVQAGNLGALIASPNQYPD